MDGQFVGEVAAGARGFDGVNVADHVGDGDVGRGQLFDVAQFAREPGDGRGVAFFRDKLAAGAADGAEGRIVDLAAGHDGDLRIEKLRQAPQDAALGLAAQAQQDEIVPRQYGVDDLRDDRVVVAVHAGEQLLAGFDGAKQVLPHLIFDSAPGAASVEAGAFLQLAECFRFSCRSRHGHRAPRSRRHPRFLQRSSIINDCASM